MRPDNPQAFPVNTSEHADCERGMTLRDYFAANALPTAERQARGLTKDINMNIARRAYAIADAMLAAR